MPQTQAQINITLGTAGHIDHGKTSLVKLLTGCETDTLKEEKERGMSIELGFAPCRLADLEVGIVDVPGHENFIKTMVAGATGIDGVILVIAADDGIMPQTREHMDILTLLGVRHGMVALTKIDMVAQVRVEAVEAEIRQYLRGTFLADAPVAPVSSVTGAGFDGFYEALKALVGVMRPKPVDHVFRMPIERTFSVKGYGTVVSGIPAAGSVRVGDEVVLLPAGLKGRIRAVQVYKQTGEAAQVGQCAAVNVPQWDYSQVQRGDVVTVDRTFDGGTLFLCRLRTLDFKDLRIKTGDRLKFHTGTSERVAAVYLLEGNSLTGSRDAVVQVQVTEPLVAGPGDRFILRGMSPPRTLGGGVVVEALERKLRRSLPEAVAEAKARAEAVTDDRAFVEYCTRTAQGHATDIQALCLRTKLLAARAEAVVADLVASQAVLRWGAKALVHRDTVRLLEQQILALVAEFHKTRPESPGIASEDLLTRSGLRKDVFEPLLQGLRTSGRLVDRKGLLALPQHREAVSSQDEPLLAAIEELFRGRPFDPPGRDDIAAHVRTPADKLQRPLRILIEQQRIIQVDRDLWFHADAVAQARRMLVDYIRQHGGLESVQFKYLLDTTRKYAIPLLDYFDKIGVTRREGYTRKLAATEK